MCGHFFSSFFSVMDVMLIIAIVLVVAYLGYQKFGVNVEPFIDDPSNPAIIFDVRSPEEYRSGHVKAAINVPHTELASKISKYVEDKHKFIIVYCRSGRRSGIAKESIEAIGYNNVHNFGGYDQARKRLVNFDK